MITIEQLLESVDLDFEPRFITKDESGWITIWEEKPYCYSYGDSWHNDTSYALNCGGIKLAEFKNKPWQECIYEVPRKTTGKIEKLPEFDRTEASIFHAERLYSVVNEIIEAVNELKGANQ